jgi:uncharacterized protein YndB with AHSA1/START domain
MSNTKITIEAEISANTKKVWDYYTNPKHITKWNFASDDWHCPDAENDLRVGGKLISRMESKEGSVGFDFEAVYDEVVDLKRIVYTIADGRKVKTEFNSQENKTKVTTTFEAESVNSIELQRTGWQSILNNFKKYVESN